MVLKQLHLSTAMTDVQTPLLGQIPAQTALAEPDTTAQSPAPTEVASETLYIQNLNEKIKVDGQHPPSYMHVLLD